MIVHLKNPFNGEWACAKADVRQEGSRNEFIRLKSTKCKDQLGVRPIVRTSPVTTATMVSTMVYYTTVTSTTQTEKQNPVAERAALGDHRLKRVYMTNPFGLDWEDTICAACWLDHQYDVGDWKCESGGGKYVDVCTHSRTSSISRFLHHSKALTACSTNRQKASCLRQSRRAQREDGGQVRIPLDPDDGDLRQSQEERQHDQD